MTIECEILIESKLNISINDAGELTSINNKIIIYVKRSCNVAERAKSFQLEGIM